MPKSKVRKKRDATRAQRSSGHAPARPTLPWLDLRHDLAPALVFPADLLGFDAPEHTQMTIDLAVGDPAGATLRRVTLKLTRRLRGPSHFELWGEDGDQSLSVHLAGSGDGRWRFRASMVADRLTGHRLQSLLELFEILTPPNQVALALPSEAATEWSPLTRPAVSVPPPEGLVRIARAHAEIEAALDIERPVPFAYRPSEVKDTLETAALLRGELVVDTWRELTWPVPLIEAHELVEGAFRDHGLAEVEVERPWQWMLDGDPVEVGIVAARYAQARLETTSLPALTEENREDTVALRLVPGEDATMTLRLVQLADRDERGDAASQRWFWTPQWQAREHEVDAHVARGAVATHDTADAFLAHLDALAVADE